MTCGLESIPPQNRIDHSRLMEGSILDKPKQFTGTSVVFHPDTACRPAVENSVRDGFEPHFAVIRGRWAASLSALADMFRIPVFRY
jgi:hypothetical protein